LIETSGNTILIDNGLKKVVITITQPSYRFFKTLRYFYKFSDDKDSTIESSPNIILENLNYGAYNIKAKNSHEAFSDGLEGEISFEVKKPFWLQLWFFALTGFCLLVFIFVFIRLRIFENKKN